MTKSKQTKSSVVTLRITKETRKQIDKLAKLWGENQSATIQRCIERVHGQEFAD
jgi:uncharacterized protein (DUF1778 family)